MMKGSGIYFRNDTEKINYETEIKVQLIKSKIYFF